MFENVIGMIRAAMRLTFFWCIFCLKYSDITSGGKNLIDFAENQLTKFCVVKTAVTKFFESRKRGRGIAQCPSPLNTPLAASVFSLVSKPIY